MEKLKLCCIFILSLFCQIRNKYIQYLLASNLLQYTILKKYYKETASLMILQMAWVFI